MNTFIGRSPGGTIPFEVNDDHERLRQIELAWKASATNAPSDISGRGPAYDPDFIYFELDDELLKVPHPILEKLGLSASPFQPDFEADDFVCRKCAKVVAYGPGVCPIHGAPLLRWIDWKYEQSEKSDAFWVKVFSPLRILLPLAAVAAIIALVYSLLNAPRR